MQNSGAQIRSIFDVIVEDLRVSNKVLLGKTLASTRDYVSQWFFPQSALMAKQVSEYILRNHFKEAANNEHLRSVFENCIAGFRDQNAMSYDSYSKAFGTIWKSASESEQTDFIEHLNTVIQEMPSIESLDGREWKYATFAARPPIQPVPMSVGDHVKLRGIGPMCEVRAKSDHFVILTFKDQYTIIDWRNGVLGPHNSWGYGAQTQEGIEKMLIALESGGIELSWRNKLRIEVERVKSS